MLSAGDSIAYHLVPGHWEIAWIPGSPQSHLDLERTRNGRYLLGLLPLFLVFASAATVLSSVFRPLCPVLLLALLYLILWISFLFLVSQSVSRQRVSDSGCCCYC